MRQELNTLLREYNTKAIDVIVSNIKKTNYKLYFTVTGGGSLVVGDFCKKGGASNNLCSFYVPYSTEVIKNFLGKTPRKFNSLETSMLLMDKTHDLYCKNPDDIAIGVCASLYKEGQREDRRNSCYVSIKKGGDVFTYHQTYDKTRDRYTQERNCSMFILLSLAKVLELV